MKFLGEEDALGHIVATVWVGYDALSRECCYSNKDKERIEIRANVVEGKFQQEENPKDTSVPDPVVNESENKTIESEATTETVQKEHTEQTPSKPTSLNDHTETTRKQNQSGPDKTTPKPTTKPNEESCKTNLDSSESLEENAFKGPTITLMRWRDYVIEVEIKDGSSVE